MALVTKWRMGIEEREVGWLENMLFEVFVSHLSGYVHQEVVFLCSRGVFYIFWHALAFWLIWGESQDSDNMDLFVGLTEVIDN